MNEHDRQLIANFRYGLIAPLVSRKLEAGEQMALMREIASHVYKTPPDGQEKRISLRTLERYVHAYRTGGWEALLPRYERTSSRQGRFRTMCSRRRSLSKKSSLVAVSGRSSRSWNSQGLWSQEP
ncbi:hypothetical protein [Paenibacillus harenae]|uniref:Helix-turn-helix domain-containing protein n=1 Tax=Paenibacillus harenae TaxID=306543 RepID=A0ABT9U397_PAEHA|nr:hypothetical protein [Paenibacillus harenae]MDQ0114112.1 hypothetical protein [Paenibacillus harenae]